MDIKLIFSTLKNTIFSFFGTATTAVIGAKANLIAYGAIGIFFVGVITSFYYYSYNKGYKTAQNEISLNYNNLLEKKLKEKEEELKIEYTKKIEAEKNKANLNNEFLNREKILKEFINNTEILKDNNCKLNKNDIIKLNSLIKKPN